MIDLPDSVRVHPQSCVVIKRGAHTLDLLDVTVNATLELERYESALGPGDCVLGDRIRPCGDERRIALDGHGGISTEQLPGRFSRLLAREIEQRHLERSKRLP